MRAALLALSFALAASTGFAQARTEIARDLVHADLPLFGGETENMWPRPFSNGDEFGCTSRVAFGDWRLREAGAENDDDAEWYRIENYGVFHCMAMVGSAYGRARLEGVEPRPSFFVLMGTTRVRGNEIELWALQIGARPGSDYLLLSRTPEEGAVQIFDVLQTECPRGGIRNRGAIDIIRTDYCAINSRSELMQLARRMAQRPPRGSFALAAAEDGDSDE
jgi:hypothetical protein